VCTKTEVRFKNQGLDSIEVQDNGSGIAPHNYESIALKHYTSKLSSYDDLSTLHTFGFRGEALSSLCALSRFSVVTCTQAEVPRATRIEFETSGRLKSTSVVSGQRGTTVIVEDLFRNLPVRRRELERNIKREWGKVISLLGQYACVQTGVKFTVSQQPTKGKRMIMFSTRGNPTTRENIINVFGVKTMNALITMDLKLELIPSTGPLNKGKARADGSAAEVRILGHISRPAHGEGRQTPDRQMFYVNGRPCALPQFAKVFNEVYRSYNASQSPFIFADIQLDTHLYDVNVSPDKRTILLHDQGQMLDNLRDALIELFETQDVTIPMSHTQVPKQPPSKSPVAIHSDTPISVKAKGSRIDAVETQHNPERSDGESGLDVASEHQEDHEMPSTKRKAQTGRASLAPSRAQTSTLLSRWIRRDTDASTSPKTESSSTQKSTETTSALELPAISASEGKDSSQEDNVIEEQESSKEDEDADKHDKPGIRAEDLGTRFSKAQTETEEVPEDTETGHISYSMPIETDEPEPPVQAIIPPSQPPAPRSIIPGTTRPFKRSSQEVATITIGDHTVTSIIGTASKRPRVAEASNTAKPKVAGRAGQQNAPLPSFGGRLSQLFSASARPEEGHAESITLTARDAGTEDIESIAEEDDADEDAMFVSPADDGGVGHDEEDGDDGGSEDEDFDGDRNSGTQLPTARLSEVPEAASEVDSPLEPTELSPSYQGDSLEDDETYLDEDEKKAQEDEKVQGMIDAAEAAARELTEEGEKRSKLFLKGRSKRKDMTLNLMQQVSTSRDEIQQRIAALEDSLPRGQSKTPIDRDSDDLEAVDAEEKLSLKISKSDFAKMRIVGQFNLGFILAVREAAVSTSQAAAADGNVGDDDDELFIIDQHASDEKYNFERLQATTTVQSQRLVQPKTLELTALEEEILLEHLPALERNGFLVRVDTSGAQPVGSRCQLLSLPLSRETTFSLSDLEELIFLLAENPTSSATTIPRPSKVRKMFAMRACRSSIMIGKALSRRQMEKVVRHMGEMEKPWNCPHGRPTMRHLCGLGGVWGDRLWTEGEHREEGMDWAAWVREKRGGD
jgi:DNA mismatch repair protein PMS2